jgi:hypothetical protein
MLQLWNFTAGTVKSVLAIFPNFVACFSYGISQQVQFSLYLPFFQISSHAAAMEFHSKYSLVCTCHFSKFPRMLQLWNFTAGTVKSVPAIFPNFLACCSYGISQQAQLTLYLPSFQISSL